MTLFMKRYLPFLGVDFDTAKFVLGRKRVRQSFVEQIARLKDESSELLGGVPTLVGEFGIPFDLQDGRAYRTGDFSQQVQAMDDTFQALEANLLSGTLWNYTADNDNRWGDQWNDEDLSVFSRDQQTDADDINSGGRALETAVRPYAGKVAGEPLEMNFEPKRTLPFATTQPSRRPPRSMCPTSNIPAATRWRFRTVSTGSTGKPRRWSTITAGSERHTASRSTRHREQAAASLGWGAHLI
jgi:hypothetical protein